MAEFPGRRTHSLQQKQTRLLLMAALPPTLILLITLWFVGASGYLIALTALTLMLFTGYCALTARHQLDYHLTTILNLVESLNQQEFSLRGKLSGQNDTMDTLLAQINQLSETMQHQSLALNQHQYLINTILRNVDVAVLAVNASQQIAFANDGAAALYQMTPDQLQHQSAAALNLLPLINGQNRQVTEWHFPAGQHRYQIIYDHYFELGQQHTLLFITDVSDMLRGETHKAWKNLLRVLSHEINNTLTPVASLSQTLRQLLPETKDDALREVDHGLAMIEERAGNLKQFINSYRQLTQLPEPKLTQTRIDSLIRSVLPLFTDRPITLLTETPIEIQVDPAQLQQLLINTLKNADEAMADKQQPIEINWQQQPGSTTLIITDRGTGITNPDNLFVPFYSTKSGGSGIGLMLCRQIAQNHGGDYTLRDRRDSPGCMATLTLPQ
ncbi:Sensor protein FixL [Vibrio aerogenes CECT 7868]|uniref:histidine kinase n=1 Tax=Vibrio aerogenes CECT 7868 TaxID=1216006 RepID=A0A1M5V5P0_9VIBR|nr:ATP-binding protein [Vibrio aerogenes]SHH70562.1 Sensor protein FixL [Vibrio aerogenes CECT 7868]